MTDRPPAPPGLTVVIDTTDADRLAPFWAEALRYRQAKRLEAFVPLLPPEGSTGPVVLVQEVPAPPPPGRQHLDLHRPADEVDAEIARLEAIGARRGEEHTLGPLRWTTMFDPDGNPFDLVRD